MAIPSLAFEPPSEVHLSVAAFKRRFLELVLLTWTLPPVVGLGFIVFVEIMSPAQVAGIMTTPLEPLYIFGCLAGAAFYLPRYAAPIAHWMEKPDAANEQAMLTRVRGFPLRFWGLFLVYLLIAPASVILAAEHYTDFVATPLVWFRIELVALIVSIIVGLPIFFLMMDLFGRAISGAELGRPVITVKTRVFLIGALVPLLIDTMLVQYYWTRTGFFTMETFVIWLALEIIAIGGSLIFVHSFGQSLAPLRSVIGTTHPEHFYPPSGLKAQSTDEIGVLTNQYQHLLELQRNYSQRLEHLVAVRTDELARANRELEAFSYSVSHDLRAPLRTIDGFSKALLEDHGHRLDSDGLHQLDRVRRATVKMSQLIDDLLMLARVTRAEFHPVRVDLSALAHELIDELRQRDPQRQVEIDIGAGVTVQGDAGLLRIALTNLLDNAWKYTGKTAKARIEFGSFRSDKDTVYFVADNGAGFDPRYADKLFGAFQRLHSDADFPGSGVGLATVQRIVHRHGGRIWAEGEPGRGARFCFTLGTPA